MAKKGNRIQVILECTEHKNSGLPGTSRYVTTKNKKNTPDRMELKKYNKKVSLEQDLRKVMDNKDIDVISIASPNHWHSLSVIWACQAGKDVYVEKPGSHNIWEGRKMVESAQKYDRIVQHGVQLRSSPAINEAIDLLRNGYIGKVYMARGLVFRWREDILSLIHI